jgi:hypothetical protein
MPGNPAAGLAKGTVQIKRDYFNKCLANGGNMDDESYRRLLVTVGVRRQRLELAI